MAPATLTDEKYGHKTISSAYAGVLIYWFAAGIQTFMALHAVSIYFTLPKKTRKPKRPFIVLILLIPMLFLAVAILSGIKVGKPLVKAIETSDGDLSKFYIQVFNNLNHNPTQIVNGVMIYGLNVVGDGILLYRCYVIYQHRLWVLILPCLTYLTSIGLVIFLLVIINLDKPSIPLLQIALISWPATAVATNVLTTAIISYRLLRMRWKIIKLLSPSPSSTAGSDSPLPAIKVSPPSHLRTYTTAASILIESALPLSVVGIIACAILGPKTVKLSSAAVPLCIWGAFAAISPQLIIYRVITGQSWASHRETTLDFDMCDQDGSGRGFGPIAFNTEQGIPSARRPEWEDSASYLNTSRDSEHEDVEVRGEGEEKNKGAGNF